MLACLCVFKCDMLPDIIDVALCDNNHIHSAGLEVTGTPNFRKNENGSFLVELFGGRRPTPNKSADGAENETPLGLHPPRRHDRPSPGPSRASDPWGLFGGRTRRSYPTPFPQAQTCTICSPCQHSGCPSMVPRQLPALESWTMTTSPMSGHRVLRTVPITLQLTIHVCTTLTVLYALRSQVCRARAQADARARLP